MKRVREGNKPKHEALILTNNLGPWKTMGKLQVKKFCAYVDKLQNKKKVV